jgi:hypothetical protein
VAGEALAVEDLPVEHTGDETGHDQNGTQHEQQTGR